MKLTKDTLIEGKIIKKGVEVKIKESSEANRRYLSSFSSLITLKKSLKEMPHISLEGKPFDLEIEAHLSSMDELKKYFYKILSGGSFSYKHGGKDILNFNQRKDLAHHLINDEVVRLMLIKRYSKEEYTKFIEMVKSFRW